MVRRSLPLRALLLALLSTGCHFDTTAEFDDAAAGGAASQSGGNATGGGGDAPATGGGATSTAGGAIVDSRRHNGE